MSEKPVHAIDLHTHSTVSDGHLTPSQLLQKAAAVGVSVLALTDHDNVAGIDKAWSEARRLGITFIPGVELSTAWPGGECHILGYFVDYRSLVFKEALDQFQESRWIRGRCMVECLSLLGIELSWERIQQRVGGGTITRSHIAEALLQAGYVRSRQEAFDRYIGENGPAYVRRSSLSPEEAVHLILQARGVPVLAHPTFVDPERDWTDASSPLIPWPFLERLRTAGLLGLEVYYGEYSMDLSKRLLVLAEHYDLIATGGSDFHGSPETSDLGSAAVPTSVVENLRQLARRCASPWL